MTPDYTQLERQIAFILEIDKLKGVLRKNKPITLERHENSAEHSWQVALLAMALQPHADEPLDIDKVIRLLLVHDIGEVDTGDTIVYAEGGEAERKAAELTAAKRIFGLLPPDQALEMLALWQEFEANQTAEARFANAMDRLMPMLLNLNREGQSWRENGIRKEQVMAKAVSKVQAGCRLVGDWVAAQVDAAAEKGYFGPTRD
ncbi:metal dependent phosphohydrolase [Pseudogulbenkiania sp. NH8B]|uniref:HD domain-containing protein n=1 Tax=Pseudogulbenkiania sp. (strain NH8B) TaxID=748280 RepID=UPI0002279E7A|nr:HD domain-containing protein [Pseudogulbenkiania sp. NH8B]BAK77131.1 metal dependent phosphohydrolase [Pseudogulbenkiania sp. NH8B]